VNLYGLPYDGYSGYGGFSPAEGSPVGPHNSFGVGTYNPQTSQAYYQQGAVNTAYKTYQAPDAGVMAAQWATPLVGAGLYGLTGLHKVMGYKGRMLSRGAAKSAYWAMGLNPEGGAFSKGARGGMRLTESWLRNTTRRAASMMGGRAFTPVAEDALSVAAEGSLGVGAAAGIGGFAAEWLAGPAEAGWAAAKIGSEGFYKPYAYARAISNQSLMQNAAVPFYGSGMGSVGTGTGLGSRGAANYGNSMEKYGMHNMFFSQKNVGHLAGMMQQGGLLTDQSTMPKLKEATMKALKDIRSILDVASVSGSEAIKMLSTFKQSGMSVSEGTKAITQLAKYGALSGLSVKQLFSQSVLPGAEQGASQGLMPGYAGLYGARVTSKFESYYHRGLLGNSVYGLLGGPAGAERLALGGISNYANSPLGQIGLYDKYMAHTGTAGGNIPGMIANYGARFAQNPVNQMGLQAMNQPYMQSQLLKKKNQGDLLNAALATTKQIFPWENSKKGVAAGALASTLMNTYGLSAEETRRVLYDEMAKQKEAGNTAQLAASSQQALRKYTTHEEHTGRTWGGYPRAIEKTFYGVGDVTSAASRGLNSGWAGVVHGFHTMAYKMEYGDTALAMSRSTRAMKAAEAHKEQVHRVTHGEFGKVVTGISRDNTWRTSLEHAASYEFFGLNVKGIVGRGGVNQLRHEMLSKKSGPEAHLVGLAEQQVSSGDYAGAQSTLADAHIHASISDLKTLRSHLTTVSKKAGDIHEVSWIKGAGFAGGLGSYLGLSLGEGKKLKAEYKAARDAYLQNPTSINKKNLDKAEAAAKSGGYATIGKSVSPDNYALSKTSLPQTVHGMHELNAFGLSLDHLQGAHKFDAGNSLAAASYFGGVEGKDMGLSKGMRDTINSDAAALRKAKTPVEKSKALHVIQEELSKIKGTKSAEDIRKATDLTEEAKNGIKKNKDKVNNAGLMHTMNLQGAVTMHARTVNVITGKGGGDIKAQSGGSQTLAQMWGFS
jgi:hypothetical protein